MSTITSEADKNCVTLPKHLDKCLIQPPRLSKPVGCQAYDSEIFIVDQHT